MNANNFGFNVSWKNQGVKDRFAKAITNAAVQIWGTKPENVIIIYNENSKENYFLSGTSI